VCIGTARAGMRTPESKRHEGGFALLEVLVAFAIAAPVLALLYRQGVTSIGITQSAAAYQEAASRAQSRLSSLTDANLAPGDQSGDDDGGFAWRTRIVPLASAAPPRPLPRSSPFAGGTTLFAVTVEVAWPGPTGGRRVVLNTRRLGPAAAVPP
jgi:general secretion pathway protein I